jgi:hypothetical protein
VPPTKIDDDIPELTVGLATLVGKHVDPLPAFLRLHDVDTNRPILMEGFEKT